MAKYGHLYLPFKPPGHFRDASCVYCGNLAQARDHVPALTWLAALGRSYFEERGLLVIWVPSCNECNTILCDERLFTIRERTLFLLRKYLKRYDKFMGGEIWNEYEISELGGRLQQAIGDFALCQQFIDRRIAILEENARLR